jgi:tRNA (guanine37-N1)-methyltransferase
MKFNIITIFPEIFNSYFNESIIKRAQENKKIKINVVNLRDFSNDKHKKVDDSPYGGGPGMVFKIEPLAKAVDSVLKIKNKVKIILFSPAGKQFDNKMAVDWTKKYKNIVMIAGHYEGVDERIKKLFKIEEISVGPYVLTGGELPAMIVVDAVSRQIEGVLGKNESLEEKRNGIGLPVYTRPESFTFKGKTVKVPSVLLQGNHKKIEEWRINRGKRLAG